MSSNNVNVVNNISDITHNSEISDRLFRLLGVEESNSIGKANDWIPVWQQGSKYKKYSKYMYSPSKQILRNTTFLEFYGDSVVD